MENLFDATLTDLMGKILPYIIGAGVATVISFLFHRKPIKEMQAEIEKLKAQFTSIPTVTFSPSLIQQISINDEVKSKDIDEMVVLKQEEYDALQVKDKRTLYYIVE